MRRQPMYVLGNDGLLAVRDAVLPQIPFAEIRRHHLDIGAGVDPRLTARRRTAAESLSPTPRDAGGARQAATSDARVSDRGSTAADTRTLEVGTRKALPRFLRRRLRIAIEVQQTRLRPGVELQFQRVVVLPRDAQPAGLTHDAADAERLALVAGLGVGLGIPRLRDLASFTVDRDAGRHASVLRCGDHAPAPVLRDDRHPRSCEVHRVACASGLRRSTRPRTALTTAGTALRFEMGASEADSKGNDDGAYRYFRLKSEATCMSSSHNYFALLVAAGALRPAARSLYIPSMNIAVVHEPVSEP